MISRKSVMQINSVITTRKRSLVQGNIFTGVCQSFCSQGEGVSLTETPLDRDPPRQRPPWTETPLDRDPWTETLLHLYREPLDRDPPPTITVESGQYASYWNSFLLILISILKLPRTHFYVLA